MLRKCICMIVTVALVVCVSVAPVGAVDAAGSFNGTLGSSYLLSSEFLDFSFPLPRSGSKAVVRYLEVDSLNPYVYYLNNFNFTPSTSSSSVGGTVGIYFSWALASNVTGSWDSFLDTYRASYSLSNTSSFYLDAKSTSFNFSPGISGLYPSLGHQLSFRIENIDTLTSLSVFFQSGSGNFAFTPDSSATLPLTINYYVPSASLVYTASSSELDALESVANQIAEGNEIARAMYGDIMAALNALKDDTALMASYINDCLTYLNSIETATIGTYNLVASYLHNLASIAQTAEDIEAELESFHTDFMSKLDLLIGTITSESDDIQATMDRIYEQLIAWLETNFKEAISPEFEGSNSDLSQGIANNDAIEQEWTGSLSDTWSAMHIADFTFDSSFTSGFMWVSGWFSNIYNSLGLYGSIVILPLIIGICKLLLGYFRFAGHGHSKGGGDVDA